MAAGIARTKGILFPFQVGVQGSPKPGNGAELIRGNILQLLATRPGERVMLPEFGVALDALIFDHDAAVIEALARDEIIRKVQRFEPRATITQIRTRITNETQINVDIAFQFGGDEQSLNAIMGF